MEEEPRNLLEELGETLTNIWLMEENLESKIDKLVEVIKLELSLILPEIAAGSNPCLEWSDGKTTILISIHVEEDHESYNLEVKTIPKI